MSKKTILTSLLTIAVCLSLIAGSTYALFTSEDSINIAVTSGKVAVTATIDGFTTYSMDEATATNGFFATGGTAALNQEASKLTLTNIAPGDKVTLNINVVNDSNVAILYRLTWTVDGTLSDALVATADGVAIANGKTAWTKWEGAATKTIAVSIALPVEYETQGESASITFAVEAVQGNSFVAPPADAVKVDSFDDLAAALTDGGSILIESDVDLTNPASGNTYITLNGDTRLYMEDGATVSFSEVALINGEGTLTVYGGELKTNQELCVTGNATLIIEDGEHTFGAFSATGNGSIIVNGGTLNCKGTYGGVMGISFGENGSLVVNGGKLNMYQPFNLNANRCDNAYIEINDGTIELLNGIENLFVVRNIMDKDNTSGTLRGSSIRVNGGTFIAHYEVDYAGDATSFIRNGDAPSDGNKVLVSNADGYDCIVTGGTFYGSWQRADNTRYTDGNGGYSDGLMVDNSIAGFVADGYEITGDPDNGYIVNKK